MGCASSKTLSNVIDNQTYDDVIRNMGRTGVGEDMNLIVAVDLTKSNEWNGKNSFAGRCLHELRGPVNPYLQVLRVMKRLFQSDLDTIIPFYGYGSIEANTRANNLIHFGNVKTVNQVIGLYKGAINSQTLAGPTTFSHIIREAIQICQNTTRYHLLIIVTDGEVSSQFVGDTKQAIDAASKHPLSIVTIGVGDGPFDQLEQWDDQVPPTRKMDNFQFVNMEKVIHGREMSEQLEQELFRMCFLEVPTHYEQVKAKLGYAPQLNPGPISGVPSAVLGLGQQLPVGVVPATPGGLVDSIPVAHPVQRVGQNGHV